MSKPKFVLEETLKKVEKSPKKENKAVMFDESPQESSFSNFHRQVQVKPKSSTPYLVLISLVALFVVIAIVLVVNLTSLGRNVGNNLAGVSSSSQSKLSTQKSRQIAESNLDSTIALKLLKNAYVNLGDTISDSSASANSSIFDGGADNSFWQAVMTTISDNFANGVVRKPDELIFKNLSISSITPVAANTYAVNFKVDYDFHYSADDNDASSGDLIQTYNWSVQMRQENAANAYGNFYIQQPIGDKQLAGTQNNVTTPSSSQVASDMNLQQIAQGDYSSIQGNWKNKFGNEIVISNNSITFVVSSSSNSEGSADRPYTFTTPSNISITRYRSYQINGLVYNYSVSFSKNNSGYSPVSWQGKINYKLNNGILVGLNDNSSMSVVSGTSIPSGGVPGYAVELSFIPKGVPGDDRRYTSSSDTSKDRLMLLDEIMIDGGSVAGYTPPDYAFYKTN